jgi:DNA-binding GntR family transcriptional regulator
MPSRNAESVVSPSTDGESALSLPIRSLMKEKAYTEIKRGILSGALPPGSFVAERQLAVGLGMSKTPIRAALERLEFEGFITISPQQGIIIRDLTLHEIADHYEIRIVLETYVARTVAGQVTAEQRERVRANLKAQAAVRDGSDVPRAVALDAEFHTLFCEFLGNQEILRVMRQLREKIHRVITKVFQINAGRIASSYEEHRVIADVVFRGDAARAAQLVEEHLNRGRQHLLSPRPSCSEKPLR